MESDGQRAIGPVIHDGDRGTTTGVGESRLECVRFRDESRIFAYQLILTSLQLGSACVFPPRREARYQLYKTFANHHRPYEKKQTRSSQLSPPPTLPPSLPLSSTSLSLSFSPSLSFLSPSLGVRLFLARFCFLLSICFLPKRQNAERPTPEERR